jgi:hypothetical protein
MSLIIKVFREKGIVASTPPPPTRAFTDGHWISLLRGNDTISAPGNNFGANLLTPNIQGFFKRQTWRVLEPQKDNYDGLSLTSELQRDLDWCSSQGCKLILQWEDRTFYNSENPIPQYFGNPSPIGGPYTNPYSQLIQANTGKIGVTLVRWEPLFVIPRMKLLIDAIAAAFGDHPAFEGLAFQETALGFDNSALDNYGYTSTRYGDFYIDILQYAATAMPKCRIFWLCNFIPQTAPQTTPKGAFDNPSGGHDNSQIGRVGQAMLNSNLNAFAIGGPDILPEDGGLRTGLYSFMDIVSNGGFRDVIPFACQFSQPGYAHEWKGANPTPYRYWTLQEMYNFMKDTPSHNCNALGLSYAFWMPVAGSDDPSDNVPAAVAENGWTTGPHPQGEEIAANNPKIHIYTGALGGPATTIFVDLNAVNNGNGQSASTPTNVLPGNLPDGQVLLFNSDNGIQRIPVRDDCIYIDGDNVEISSYGAAGIAIVSGFQIITGGWTLVGSGVWKHNWGTTQGVMGVTGGNLVGAVIDKASTAESPQGDVLKWYNLDSNDPGATPDLRAAFVAAPTVLPVGYYAYDYVGGVLYINVGGNPNTGGRSFGVAGCGRFVSVQTGKSPANAQIHNLRLMGFARAGVNAVRGANNWRVHHNQLYANGGIYSTSNNAYSGSGVVLGNNASTMQVDHNLIEQTFDSPVSCTHISGANAEIIDSIHVHHNTIRKWGLAAIEVSDFGTNNITSNVNAEFNIATGGGTGFSATGDAPQGFTDGFQVRGGNTNGSITGLRCANSTLQSHDAAVGIHGNNGDVLVTACRLSTSAFGLQNERTQVVVTGSSNQFCQNTDDVSQLTGVAVNGSASGSTYSGNTTQAGECYVTDRAGEGINY